MKHKKTTLITIILSSIFFIQCYTTKWTDIGTTGELEGAPLEVQAMFDQLPDKTMILVANSPGYDYQYDVGEKDTFYGTDSLAMRFCRVELALHEEMPAGKVIVDITFTDGMQNKLHAPDVDLLRLVPRYEAPGDMIYPEMLLEEFNRFGYTFRKEHGEFTLELTETAPAELTELQERAYRLQIVNNCLAPTKWEFSLNAEDYSDFDERLKSKTTLNQNKIIAHSWFYLDQELYHHLLLIKNPELNVDLDIPYNTLSDISENVVIGFDQIRNPIKYRVKTELLEVGHKSNRMVEPLDNEQYYKKQFELFLSEKEHTYASILEEPVRTTQFQDQGYYTALTPNEFDLSWMKQVDKVYLDVIDIEGTDAFVEITLTGKYAPYNINIGNIDLSQIDEQKLYGLLFGFNTYPKNRRYNPQQTTIAYDADLLPNDIKPYVLLTQSSDGLWVNNQYKGIEKIFLTYDSIEGDVLSVYVLSYERITPIWMAKVKLPKSLREKVRIRRALYSY